ncbi:FAD:protein FMN transferase [Thiomonas sp.]|jgi:thiamine biosynthesis lipoprotein|uniref:FAD:protein FMN transferase n=1 Tax=Thiomonas sp. TaxID=2047785 RepID=UPI00260FF86C|nr:FAD:protein FMN transferase [Thiomonas sp.]
MSDSLRWVARLQPQLGTWVEIRACGPAQRIERAVRCAYGHIARVQQRMSFHHPDSMLTRLNLHAHRQPQPADALTWAVLRKALAMWRASGGVFDVTVAAPLVRRGVLPDHGFSTLRAPIGSDALVLLPQRQVALRRPVLLTLDGIAKGEAVDRAIACLRRWGVVSAVVNAGGDLRAFGTRPVPLAVRASDGVVHAAGSLQNAAVASSMQGQSGEQQRRFPGRLLHPAQPARPDGATQVWTVMAAQCWRADALTKVAALAEAPQRAALVARLGGRLLQVEAWDGGQAA